MVDEIGTSRAHDKARRRRGKKKYYRSMTMDTLKLGPYGWVRG